jgi:hypothetical protein
VAVVETSPEQEAQEELAVAVMAGFHLRQQALLVQPIQAVAVAGVVILLLAQQAAPASSF